MAASSPRPLLVSPPPLPSGLHPAATSAATTSATSSFSPCRPTPPRTTSLRRPCRAAPLIRVTAPLIRVAAPLIRVAAPLIRVTASLIRVAAPLIRVAAPLIQVASGRHCAAAAGAAVGLRAASTLARTGPCRDLDPRRAAAAPPVQRCYRGGGRAGCASCGWAAASTA